MVHLSKTAKKEDQIAKINVLVDAFNAVVDFVNGDEDAITRFCATLTDIQKSPAVEPTVDQLGSKDGFIIEKPGPQLVPEIKLCTCDIAVKEKDGTQLCMVCQGNAYSKHFVFAHTDEGQHALNPYSQAAIEANLDAAPVQYVAEPAEFAENTDHERFYEQFG